MNCMSGSSALRRSPARTRAQPLLALHVRDRADDLGGRALQARRDFEDRETGGPGGEKCHDFKSPFERRSRETTRPDSPRACFLVKRHHAWTEPTGRIRSAWIAASSSAFQLADAAAIACPAADRLLFGFAPGAVVVGSDLISGAGLARQSSV